MNINTLEANFTVLIMSMASAAEMAMGLIPDPQTQNISIDKDLAKFNIDMLLLLRDKTQGHLTAEEKQFLDSILNKLQNEFIKMK